MSMSMKEDRVKAKHSPVVKQKRKKPHPVRQYFEYEGAKQQRCRFCNWITRENATRMVQHIAYRCKNAGQTVRIAMQANLEDAKERESNSSLTEHNKKDIHSLFNPRDNDRKRECLFCGWITIVNLTRMRQHITSVCKEVPPETRSRFIKAEGGEECSFRIVNVDDRSEFEIISCKSLSNIHQVDVMDDMAMDNEDDGNQEYQGAGEGYIVYGELESEPDQRQEEAGTKQKPARRQLIAQVIVEGAEMADLEGAEDEEAEEEEDEQEEDETEKAEENVELQEQADIEYLEVEHRECHWCRTTVSAEKEDVWVDGKLFCSSECRAQEQDDQQPKHDVPKKETEGTKHEHVPQGTRAYIKKIMPQVRSGEQTSARKHAAQKGPDGQMKARQPSLRSNTTPVPAASKTAVTRKTSPEKASSRVPPKRIASREAQERSVSTSAAYRRAPVVEARQKHSAAAIADEGSCHSFGGGHVYPQEAPRFVDHKLQYTKAVISRPAPEFEATAVVEGAFKKIKLSDYRGKYLVFFFYPLDFTFVCPTEILAFSDRVNEFKKLNAEVIAASIDSHFTHLAWINTPRKEGGLGQINIPLVSDITHSIAKDYGVYLDDLGHTLRGLFIIDDRGVLRQITMNDLPVGRSVDETLRLVQAFQYTDKHGEVCPAGWKPGQDTIVPNPEAKIKYFEKNH